MRSWWKIIFVSALGLVVLVVILYERTLMNEVRLTLTEPTTYITLNGREVDTAFLFSEYKDPGAYYLDKRKATRSCDRHVPITESSGSVNTHVLGTYTLSYSYYDDSLREEATVTRSVHVVENPLSFLNGSYDVVYSGTVTPLSSGAASLTTGQYTTVVETTGEPKRFRMFNLNNGVEMLLGDGYAHGDSIELGCWTPDYARFEASGRLSPAGNSFTIETLVYPYANQAIYRFRNVFTKHITIADAGTEQR